MPSNKRRYFRLLKRANVKLEKNKQLRQQCHGHPRNTTLSRRRHAHGEEVYFVSKVITKPSSEAAVSALHVHRQQMRVLVAFHLRQHSVFLVFWIWSL